MPESPDFGQIARALVERNGWKDDQPLIRDVVQQLRLAWNARGAADRALLTEHFNEAPADIVANALRTLDR